MKLLRKILVGAVMLSMSAAFAAEKPLARLTLRSYTDATNAVSHLAAAFEPNSTEDPLAELNQSLGLSNLATLDLQRPWEVALWYGAGRAPLLALKAPTTDVDKFKENLSPEGLLRDKGQEWLPAAHGFAVIVFRAKDSLSDEEQAALDEYKAAPVAAPKAVAELNLALTEEVRAQALGMLAIGRMSMGSVLSAQSAKAGSSVNPAALEGMLNLYFDGIETFLAGLQETTIGLDCSSNALEVCTALTPKPETELAKLLQKPSCQLTAQDLKWLDPEASMALAGCMPKSPAIQKLAGKFLALSFQMQEAETNGVAVRQLNDLISKTLPMAFAGSVEFKSGFAFEGVYRFPEANVNELYSQTKQVLTNNLQAFVGTNKTYSAAALREKCTTIGGVAVDQLTLTINADSAAFRLPGQKEQLHSFWPNGKVEIDYAIKGDRLLAASPGRMKALLEKAGNPNANPAFMPGEGAVLVGHLNLVSLMRQVTAANPAIPEPVKDKMAKLDSQGTALEFEVRVDHQLHSRSRIPFKLLREMGNLKQGE